MIKDPGPRACSYSNLGTILIKLVDARTLPENSYFSTPIKSEQKVAFPKYKKKNPRRESKSGLRAGFVYCTGLSSGQHTVGA